MAYRVEWLEVAWAKNALKDGLRAAKPRRVDFVYVGRPSSDKNPHEFVEMVKLHHNSFEYEAAIYLIMYNAI